MEIAITKMSANGQIVIPSEIRKEAGIKPSEKFIVASQGKDILLQRVNEKQLKAELDLIRRVREAEANIAAGKGIRLNTDMTFEEWDDILMGRKSSGKSKSKNIKK